MVLFIVSMTSAFLFDAASNMSKAVGFVTSYTAKSSTQIPANRWLRDLVGSSVSVHRKDSPHIFSGNSLSLQGTSMSGVFSPPGELTRFRLTLKAESDGTILEYTEDNLQPVALIELGSEATFSYENSKGQKSKTWPLESGLMGSIPRLLVLDDGKNIPLKISFNARRLPVRDLRDLL